MWITVDKQSSVPMFRQVYLSLRSRILSGELAAGFRLPSTRELASRLAVSRNIILEAYELLLAEGFIVSRSGSGTFVAEGAIMPPSLSPSMPLPTAEPVQFPDGSRDLASGNGIISFKTGMPDVTLFPRKTWGDLLRNASRDAADASLGYGDPAGEPRLRTVLSGYLSHTRGVTAGPGQLVITGGAVQAIQLAARLLLSPGDTALVEEPTNAELKTILSSTGATVLTLPADDSGLVTGSLPKQHPPKLIYVTPSHQFPLGGILPIQRRIELIRYARETGSLIIEDDYDSEFRYDGAPVHSLQSLAPERVFYIGTFSKVMFPALRIGYAVLPPPFIEDFIRLKRLTDYQTPGLTQLALAQFIERKGLYSHIYKMKKVYRRRRDVILESLNRHFAGQVRICGRAAGLHLTAEFSFPLPENLPELFEQEGVYADVLSGNRLILGYGHLDEGRIREGVQRVKRAMERG
ncbi:PLP-dependent aminotransferase family protein [Paenibacillus sp. 7124]|uniref:PLP-dependent aminotransferase family protein n=1 Tax=Paenibacillus apii TaxID=1850370 RepID=A0A6M1PIQ3_9BACL|nr:PLP-dependent aminotransferase family protein [Paenibacillus apii]NGM82195.1 PLP-dependent aminotransferase family protein [Paenibacillus apii]NJJ39332.1 PLP-dependent aminotransferase family protein [Paenibacillus apii]